MKPTKKRPKKVRKLGKWVNGLDGQLTKKYKTKRKKQRRAARRARSTQRKHMR